MSKNTDNINFTEISQRIHQTDFIDGFAFIFIGLVLIISAGIVNFNFTLGPLILVVVVEIFRPSVSDGLRKRFTYPRIGFYKIKPENTGRAFLRVIIFLFSTIMISIMIILVLEGGNFTNLYGNIWKYCPIILGLILFGPSMDVVNRTGQSRYYGIGIFSTLFGIFIFLMNFSRSKAGFAVYLTVLGVLFIILGFITFIRFIQTYPLNSENEKNTDMDSKNE